MSQTAVDETRIFWSLAAQSAELWCSLNWFWWWKTSRIQGQRWAWKIFWIWQGAWVPQIQRSSSNWTCIWWVQGNWSRQFCSMHRCKVIHNKALFCEFLGLFFLLRSNPIILAWDGSYAFNSQPITSSITFYLLGLFLGFWPLWHPTFSQVPTFWTNEFLNLTCSKVGLLSFLQL